MFPSFSVASFTDKWSPVAPTRSRALEGFSLTMNDLSENTRIFTEKYKTSHQEIQKIPPAGPSLKGFSLTMNDLSENTKIFTEKYKKNPKEIQKIPPAAGPSRAFL